jgi:AcrR family transcriptional regulator
VDGRSLRYQQRRPELLDRVADYVLEHGVAELAMRPLASAIGVSHATLLHHFGSKEKLITEVVELLSQRMADAAQVAETQQVEDLVQWWQQTTTPQYLPAYRLMFEVYAQAVREPDRYERYLQRVAKDSLALMENLLRADGCPADQAPLLASLVVAQARGLQLDLIATQDHDRVDRSFGLFVSWLGQLEESWRNNASGGRVGGGYEH